MIFDNGNDNRKGRRDYYIIPPLTYFPSLRSDVPAIKSETKKPDRLKLTKG